MIRTHMLRAAAALGLALGVAACEAPPAAPEAAAVPGTLPTVDMAAAQAAAVGSVPLQVLEFSPSGTRSLTSRIRGDAAPAYAVPVFLRVKAAMETTGTFKYQKAGLKKEGFDPAQCGGEAVHVLLPGTSRYVPVTDEVYADIIAGKFRF